MGFSFGAPRMDFDFGPRRTFCSSPFSSFAGGMLGGFLGSLTAAACGWGRGSNVNYPSATASIFPMRYSIAPQLCFPVSGFNFCYFGTPVNSAPPSFANNLPPSPSVNSTLPAPAPAPMAPSVRFNSLVQSARPQASSTNTSSQVQSQKQPVQTASAMSSAPVRQAVPSVPTTPVKAAAPVAETTPPAPSATARQTATVEKSTPTDASPPQSAASNISADNKFDVSKPITVYGDSIAEGLGKVAKKSGGKELGIVNASFYGTEIRFEPVSKIKRGEQVLISLGYNDAGAPQDYTKRVVKLVNQIRDRGAKVAIAGIEATKRNQKYNDNVRIINEQLKEAAVQTGVQFVDISSFGIKKNSGGLHYSKDNYKVLYEKIIEELGRSSPTSLNS